MMCFGVFVGSLSDDYWICVLVLFVVWVRCPALGTADTWVVPGLGHTWRSS